MNIKKRVAALLLTAFALALVAGGALTASAHELMDEDHREEVREAIESGDYDLWVELMEEADVGDILLKNVNEDNFYLLQDLLEATDTCDVQTKYDIREELGLPIYRAHNHHKHWKEFKHGEDFEDTMEAIEDEDYDGWYDLVIDERCGEYITSIVTEDNFDLFAEMVDARREKDFERVKEIREELGLFVPDEE